MRLRWFIWMMAVLILSCDNTDKKEPEPQPEVEFVKPPIDCLKKKRVLDSLETAQALIGKWEWKYANCGWRDPSDEYFKGVTVIFSDDGTMTLTGDGDPRTTNWTLKRTVDKGNFELDIHSVEICLIGHIVHCESYVMFSDLPVDGCDNIFKKVE